jgi:ABC-type lipoprotein release transport system permease subunit
VALGASGSEVVSLIVRTAMRPVIIGAVGGLLVWLWMASLLSALLFRIEARDTISAAVGLVSLALVAAIACLWPARRASRVDPAITLRVD